MGENANGFSNSLFGYLQLAGIAFLQIAAINVYNMLHISQSMEDSSLKEGPLIFESKEKENQVALRYE